NQAKGAMDGSATGMALEEEAVWATPTKAPANSSIYRSVNVLHFYSPLKPRPHRNTAPWWNNFLNVYQISAA
ncbi:uncharacterized protein METZ01_LOCUS310963, partial [marine metagenome]